MANDVKCKYCGLYDGHANSCYVDVLHERLEVLERCKAALEEIEAAWKSCRGITLSEALAIVRKGLHGDPHEGHVPSSWEMDTDVGGASSHTYRACVTCGETLWTCHTAYTGKDPHPVPKACTGRKA